MMLFEVTTSIIYFYQFITKINEGSADENPRDDNYELHQLFSRPLQTALHTYQIRYGSKSVFVIMT